MLFLLLNVLSFLVAIPFVAADYPAFNNSQDALDGRYGKYPIQRYISDPELRTPVANVLVQPQEGVSPKKYIMWAPGGAGLPITGPMMLDAATLNTVWQGPVTAAETIGTTVQTCNNTDYITSWSGRGHAGGKAGMFHIVRVDGHQYLKSILTVTSTTPLTNSCTMYPPKEASSSPTLMKFSLHLNVLLFFPSTSL